MSMIEDSDYLGVRNDRTTKSIEAGSDSEAIEEENKHLNDICGGEREIEINIEKGNDVDCVGETEISEVVDSKRVERSPICPTLRDLMILDDKDIDEPCFTRTTHVDNNQPSTEEANPKVVERLNLEKQDSELDAYILEKLSLLRPSFRTLFEPSVAGGSSDNNKTGRKAVSESKWKKKIEDAIAKVKPKSKQQQADPPNEEVILYETDVKGILKMRWEEEKKRQAIKQRRRWATSCICCLLRSQKNIKDWEFQLEEYSYAW